MDMSNRIEYIFYVYYICGHAYKTPYIDAPCANTQVHIGNIYHVHINVRTCPQKEYVWCVYYMCGHTYKTACIDTPCAHTRVRLCQIYHFLITYMDMCMCIIYTNHMHYIYGHTYTTPYIDTLYVHTQGRPTFHCINIHMKSSFMKIHMKSACRYYICITYMDIHIEHHIWTRHVRTHRDSLRPTI